MMKVKNPFTIVGEEKRYHQFRPRYHHRPSSRLSILLKGKVQKALDVACGTGHSSLALKAIADKVIAIDSSKEMLSQAKTQNNMVEFSEAFAESLPFRDREFGLVNVSMGFHWLEQEKFLDEAKRVLQDEGVLKIDSFGFDGQISKDQQLQGEHNAFINKYLQPASKKEGFPSRESLKKFNLQIVDDFEFEEFFQFSAQDFINLITTWSNFLVKPDRQKSQILKEMNKLYVKIFSHQQRKLRFIGRSVVYKYLSLLD